MCDRFTHLNKRSKMHHGIEFIRSKTFREVLSAHHKETGLCGYLLLFAHGEVNGNGNWFFHDGERRLLMQNWIDRNDGNCLAMLLSCCNSRDYEVSSKKSIIIHPACDIELMRPSNLRIFVPGEGYLDKYRQRREYIESHC